MKKERVDKQEKLLKKQQKKQQAEAKKQAKQEKKAQKKLNSPVKEKKVKKEKKKRFASTDLRNFLKMKRSLAAQLGLWLMTRPIIIKVMKINSSLKSISFQNFLGFHFL